MSFMHKIFTYKILKIYELSLILCYNTCKDKSMIHETLKHIKGK